jgi:hypothetical protein
VSERIEFQATVYKVQTLVDGSVRLTLDLPEHATEKIMGQLAECQRWGKALSVVAEPE